MGGKLLLALLILVGESFGCCFYKKRSFLFQQTTQKCCFFFQQMSMRRTLCHSWPRESKGLDSHSHCCRCWPFGSSATPDQKNESCGPTSCERKCERKWSGIHQDQINNEYKDKGLNPQAIPYMFSRALTSVFLKIIQVWIWKPSEGSQTLPSCQCPLKMHLVMGNSGKLSWKMLHRPTTVSTCREKRCIPCCTKKATWWTSPDQLQHHLPQAFWSVHFRSNNVRWNVDPSTELPFDTKLLANIAGNTVIELYPTFVDMWAQCAPSMQFCTSPQLGPKGKNRVGVVPSNFQQIGWRQLLSALDHSQLPGVGSDVGFVSHLHWLVSWVWSCGLCCHLGWDFFETPKSWAFVIHHYQFYPRKDVFDHPFNSFSMDPFPLRVELWCGGLMLGSGPVPPVWVLALGWSQLAAWFEGKTVSDFWISASGSEKKSVFSLSLEFQFHKSGISWPATQTGNLCKEDSCCQQKLSPTFLVCIVDFLRKRWLASNKQRHLLWAQKRQKCCLRRMGWELGMVGQKIGLYHTLYIHLCIHI